MFATKRLLSSSIPKQTSTLSSSQSSHQMMILPPRSTWDTLQSATQAIISLFTQPNNRDKFVSNVNDGIINPNILGQMEFGLFMSLALHHDLNGSTSFLNQKKFEFDVGEFVKTSHYALENFQECLYSVDQRVILDIENEIRKQKVLGDCDDDGDKDKVSDDGDDVGNDVGNATDHLNQLMDDMQKRKELIESILTPIMDKNKAISASASANDTETDTDTNDENTKKDNVIETKDTVTDTDADDSFNYHQLRQMTSKQLLDSIDTQFQSSVIQCYMNDMMRMNYKPESGKVLNVALMSARAHEVPPKEDENDNGNNDDDKNDTKTEIMMDDSFSNHREEDDHPVVAQVEVLYTISQTFTQKKIGGKRLEDIMDSGDDDNDSNDGNGDGNESEIESNDEDESSWKEKTMETAWVGVFEGWLDGNEPLRWKLVDNRPAWEFPMMSNPASIH